MTSRCITSARVTADDADMAVLFAQSIYDEHPWIEMIVAPRDQTHTVIAS